jgi:hypothetical protein
MMVIAAVEEKKGDQGSGIRVTVPTSARAMAAGAGGSGIVAPPIRLIVPEAVASLIWLDMWRRNEKPSNWTRFSMVVRVIGLSIPVSGSVAVQETLMVIVFGLNETRSIPWTVASRDAVVSLESTRKSAIVELPMKLRLGIWVSGSVMRTTNVTRIP